MTPRRFVVGAVVLLLSLACGSAAPTDPVVGNENRAACERYVSHMNGLVECMNVTYDAANLCLGIESSSSEMAAYYDCLTSHSSCEGPEPRLDLDGCKAPVL